MMVLLVVLVGRRTGVIFERSLSVGSRFLSWTIEEQINHDIPLLVARDDSLQSQNLTSKKPEEKTDGFSRAVVARNGNVNVFQIGISIAKGNCWKIHIGSLFECLVINSRIGDNEETWFEELGLDLIGESSRSEAARDGVSSGEVGELENGALANLRSRNDADFRRSVNSCNDSSSENQLLPCLGNVDDVHTVVSCFPDISFHFRIDVLRAKMDVGGEHSFDVIF